MESLTILLERRLDAYSVLTLGLRLGLQLLRERWFCGELFPQLRAYILQFDGVALNFSGVAPMPATSRC